ncbi:MAG: hypothetical protein UU13_C0022G0008 [Candidatus Nomurabacteria bacterium GW2011_GWB1_40_7]|uniref:Uncharacterized protein n=1 Tax=Candidatus Nomurabacteria bacterium GW2011_GWB1_40_7 TaxID=1618744 RepID=A0A0G0W3C0_9BACT|nr:MAG: hypothetical protein UU13_C0022G0008 [Candidatus Nomurabacteria bacterium GW2011_GWB1_40_7]
MRELTGPRAIVAIVGIIVAFLAMSASENPMRMPTTIETVVIGMSLFVAICAMFRVDELVKTQKGGAA